MGKLIKLSIDVTKIDKDRLFEGKKGTYLDLMVELKDEEDDYGNTVAAWEGQTEEERKEKKNRNFLGNGKVVWESGDKPKERSSKKDDDLPF